MQPGMEQRQRHPHHAPEQNSFSNAGLPQQGQGYQPYAYPAPDLNNPMLQMAAVSGAQFFDSGQRIIQNNVQQYVSVGILRYYFSVDTSYVVKKLGVLLWPFTHKSWAREKDNNSASQEGYAMPRHDVNSPDLYIPVMALVTYIIAIGIYQGWTSSFTPEVLGRTASSGLVLVALEVFILKLGFYLLDGPKISFLDFICYSAYKYVGIVVTTLVHFLFGGMFGYLALALTGLAMSWFMFKTIAATLSAAEGQFGTQVQLGPKHYFVVAAGAMQLPISWCMGV